MFINSATVFVAINWKSEFNHVAYVSQVKASIKTDLIIVGLNFTRLAVNIFDESFIQISPD